MPKKQARSDRDVDLPDWADDVTPADEVMKKFYAPTGSFKVGPIVPAAATRSASAVVAPDESQASTGPRPKPSGEEKASPVASIPVQNEAAQVKPTAQENRSGEILPHAPPLRFDTHEAEKAPVTPLPPSASEINQVRASAAANSESVVLSRPDASAGETAVPRQISSFEDFARKWKRYLYPGQLAVMRTLFELTNARGVSECFTRYSEIASSTKMTRRNCINVVNSLVERGFVERLEVRNDATGKGILLRVHPDPVL